MSNSLFVLKSLETQVVDTVGYCGLPSNAMHTHIAALPEDELSIKVRSSASELVRKRCATSLQERAC